MKQGDFGRFIFIEKYRNGKLISREYDLYGTVTGVFDDCFKLRDNDSDHIYKVYYSDLKEFKKIEPGIEVKQHINKLLK